MTKTIGWQTSTGKTVEITMTHESTMIDDTSYSDGYNINLGRKPHQYGTLAINIDGAKFASIGLDKYTKADEVSGYTLKQNPQLAGLYRVAQTNLLATKENADLFNRALGEVIEGGKSEEYKAHEATEAAKTADQEIEWANGIIAKTTEQGRLFSGAEIKIMATNYNNLYNEGGEGYVPTWVSQEQYNEAQLILNR